MNISELGPAVWEMKMTTVMEYGQGKRAAEDVVVSRFLSLNALSPESSVDIMPVESEEGACFDHLRSEGVIKGANGGFYLDERALESLRRRRRGWLAGGTGLAAVAAGVLGWVLYRRR